MFDRTTRNKYADHIFIVIHVQTSVKSPQYVI